MVVFDGGLAQSVIRDGISIPGLRGIIITSIRGLSAPTSLEGGTAALTGSLTAFQAGRRGQDEESHMDFGRAVKIMRTARGMSQAELAELVGSSQTIISFIETGLVRATDETAAKIQKVLDFSPASDEALKTLLKDAD